MSNPTKAIQPIATLRLIFSFYLKKYENEIQTINSITTEKIMASR